VNRQNGFDRLQLDNNFILDEKIQSVSEVDAHAVIAHRQRELCVDTQPPFSKFMSQADLVSAFKKARAKNGMNAHGRIDNLPADPIEPSLLFLSDLSAIYLSDLCVDHLAVNHLVRPESICSFSPAAAWAAASRAVSTRKGEHET